MSRDHLVSRYLLWGAAFMWASVCGAQEASVSLDGRPLFTIRASFGAYGPEHRAADITRRLAEAAQDASVKPDEVGVTPGEDAFLVTAGPRPLLAVTPADAQKAGLPQPELARQRAAVIRAALVQYRRAHSFELLLERLGRLTALWLLFLVLALAVRWLRRTVLRRLEHRTARLAESPRLRGFHQLMERPVLSIGRGVLRLIATLLLLMAFLFSLSYSFSLFPATSHITMAVEGYAGDSLRRIFAGVIGYLPNLVFLIILAVLIYYGLKLLRLILNGLGTGVISLPGFYSEWAGPTYNLLAFLTVLFALVVAFPYLPGGDSPVLRGVSLFIGVLVSLGSGSAMGNVVAGIILTYMRSFRVGDRVKIADTTGDVMEQTLLVTRLRTIKNEEIAIPNSLILGAHVMNYSAANLQRRLILHVTLTIGYDVPWRQVHDLLLEAARGTPRTLADPPPFVLQISLNDSHISYQLNVHTDQPQQMVQIYSDLHSHIQDRFNQAGVEIMSPSYLALRDGNQTTTPLNYVPPTA